jgi:hypothetical protein
MSYTTGPQLRVLDTATGTAGPVLCTYSNQATGIAPVLNSLPPPVGFYQTFCRNGRNILIPDNSTVRDTINSTLCLAGIVFDINVVIDTFLHSWDSNMSFTLSQGITSVQLITNRGGSGDNFIGTELNDSAANLISSGTAPFTGSFRPEQQLNMFNGRSPGGLWILTMTDNSTGDTGMLKAWCLIIVYLCPIGGINTIEIPFAYRLYQNYPNPFNPVTTIKYGLPRYGLTSLTIYDVLGRVVTKLVENEFNDAGTYEVKWDASGFSSGIYFYTLESGSYKETKKMVLMK